MLNLLAENAEIFVWYRATPLQLVVLTLTYVLVPTVLAWAIEVVVGLVWPPGRRWAHAVLLATFLALFTVQVIDHLTAMGPAFALGIALVVGTAGAAMVMRMSLVRTWLHLLALAPVAFALLFLFASPVTGAVLSGGPDAADARVGAPHRVVMIVLDELPTVSLLDGSGHVDSELYPNLAELADNATWYRNHTTVAPLTQTAVPAITSGDYPSDERALPIAPEYPHTLFTLLGETYQMNVFEKQTQLCPMDVCSRPSELTANGGLNHLLKVSSRLWADSALARDDSESKSFNPIAGAQTVEFGSEFVRSLTPSRHPRLDFLHILLPHQPWTLAATGQDYDGAGIPGLGPSTVWEDGGASSAGRQRHLLQLQATDHLLGRVFDRLRAIDEWDDSLVVVTADHGVSFSVGTPLRSINEVNAPEIAWTPLFIKAPGQEHGTIDDRVALAIDVVPTIASHLQLELPWDVDGRSLTGKPRLDATRRVLKLEAHTQSLDRAERYLEVEGVDGFTNVLAGRAAYGSGDPKEQLFRLTDYHALVGQDSARFVDRNRTPVAGVVQGNWPYRDVVPEQSRAPWLFLKARLDGPAVPSRAIAIEINGTIAATAATTHQTNRRGVSIFSTTLPPERFRPGRNRVAVYVIEGTPDDPVLVPVRFDKAAPNER